VRSEKVGDDGTNSGNWTSGISVIGYLHLSTTSHLCIEFGVLYLFCLFIWAGGSLSHKRLPHFTRRFSHISLMFIVSLPRGFLFFLYPSHCSLSFSNLVRRACANDPQHYLFLLAGFWTATYWRVPVYSVALELWMIYISYICCVDWPSGGLYIGLWLAPHSMGTKYQDQIRSVVLRHHSVQLA